MINTQFSEEEQLPLEYYSAIKRNEVLINVRWINPENMPNEMQLSTFF